MKIAFFSDCFLDLTGGIVTSIKAQKSELERRGHTVYVFSSSYPKTKRELRGLKKEHVFPVKSCRIIGRGLTPISRRPAIIERELLKTYPELKDFDVFYIHYEAGCSIAGLRLGKKLGIRTIQVMHGREDIGEQNLVPLGLKTIVAVLLNWFHSWYLPHPVKISRDDYLAPTIAAAKMWTLMVNHANFADLVLTPSEHFKQKLQAMGVKKTIKVLPNGVSDEFFAPKLKPRTLLPDETMKIIWHSSVSKEKRIMPILQPLECVKGKYHLDVYGDGNDLSRARHYANLHHLNVSFHPATPFAKIYPKIAASHLDVLVSNGFDTFGMTLIEAESAGTPAFFVDPDLAEVVPKGGAVLSSGPSPTAMATALDELMMNPDRIEQMSKVMLVSRDSVRVSRTVDLLEKYIKS
ncbi:MAG: glycosyltransferase [Candidatus Saccharibacteria bacterium]|nr:glycosyltransferase [Candidatus Saccharibacteria bacterium]